MIEAYIRDHNQHYVGGYKYRCGYRSDENAYKFKYYMLDEAMRRIEIFVEIRIENRIRYTFSETLNDRETHHIVVDALAHILEYIDEEPKLHYSKYEDFVNKKLPEDTELAPIDYMYILEYMRYHYHITRKTIEDYYRLIKSHIKYLRKLGKYDLYLKTIRLIVKNSVYEHIWVQSTSKYIESEYEFHLYYLRDVIKHIAKHMDEFHTHAHKELYEMAEYILGFPRFCFAVMTDLGALLMTDKKIMNNFIEVEKDRLKLGDKKNSKDKDYCLAYSYLYYTYISDYDQYIEVVKDYLRLVVSNMLEYANASLDRAIGNTIVKNEGYGVVLDLFEEDFDTFIFTCFPIADFPEDMQLTIRDLLVKGVYFFAGRMEDESFRMSSLEQTININRLLLYNYREWYTK